MDVQYSQKAVFSLEKGSKGFLRSLPSKKIPSAKFLISPTGMGINPRSPTPYRYLENPANRGLNLKNTFCILYLWGWGFHVKPVFFKKEILVVTCSLMS